MRPAERLAVAAPLAGRRVALGLRPVCARFLHKATGPSTRTFFREPRIPANSPPANAVRRIGLPRRPFLVALAGVGASRGGGIHASRALETPPLSAVITAGARPPARAGRGPVAAPGGQRRLEREVRHPLELPPARPAAGPPQRRPRDCDAHRARHPEGVATPAGGAQPAHRDVADGEHAARARRR